MSVMTQDQRSQDQRSGRGERSRRAPAQREGSIAAALDLLDRAHGALLSSCRASTTTDRYVEAHLAALRAAAAVLAARSYRGSRVGNVWDGLTSITPELSEWADYFALVGARRAALEAGSVRVTSREADDVLRAAETFLGLVQAALGLPMTRVDPVLAVAGFDRT